MNFRFSWMAICASTITVVVCLALARAQDARMQAEPGKNFLAPEYYPASNGVRRIKSVVAGSEFRLITNGIVWLQNPRLTNFTPDGRIEWTVASPECIVNINTREVHGNTNMVFRTADEKLFISGVGFFWQHTNSMLILSNQSYTWIDKRALMTNAAPSDK